MLYAPASCVGVIVQDATPLESVEPVQASDALEPSFNAMLAPTTGEFLVVGSTSLAEAVTASW